MVMHGACPTPPLPAAMASAQVKCGTYNCEQGLRSKFKPIVEWATRQKVRFPRSSGNWRIPCPTSPSSCASHLSMHYSPGAHAGTAILVRSAWSPFVRRVFNHDTGRLVGVLIQSLSRAIIIVSAYMPTSLDSCAEGSDDAALALRLYSTITQWTSECPRGTRVVIMGDLNETIDRRDRKTPSRHCNASSLTSLTLPMPTALAITTPMVSHALLSSGRG